MVHLWKATQKVSFYLEEGERRRVPAPGGVVGRGRRGDEAGEGELGAPAGRDGRERPVERDLSPLPPRLKRPIERSRPNPKR